MNGGYWNALEWTKLPTINEKFEKSGSKKAIEIANALKEKNYDDKRAISIATEQAEKWYQHRSDLKDDTPFKKNLRRHS